MKRLNRPVNSDNSIANTINIAPHTALIVIALTWVAFALGGCSGSERVSKSIPLTTHTVSTASLAQNAILIGTLEHGALAHLDSTATPNYIWRDNTPEQFPVSAVAYSQKGNLAITAAGSTLNLWDTKTGQSKQFLSAPAKINAVAINPAGTLAVLGLDNHSATVLNLEIGGIVKTWPHRSPVLAVAINNQGIVLTGEESNKAHLWDIKKTEPLYTLPHADAVTFVAFSPNGKTAVSASRYDAIHFWKSTDDFKLIDSISSKAMALKAGRRAVDLKFINENRILMAFSDNTVEFRKLNSAEALKQWAIGKKTFLAKESSAPIAIGEFEKQWYVLQTDGKLYNLGDL